MNALTESADRLPPHSPEAEQGVLGCILLKPSDSILECLATMPSGSDVFYDLRHRLLYEQLLWMYEAGKPIDNVTVIQHLKDKEMLTDVGGLAYVAALPDYTPSAENIGHYMSILVSKRLGRAILRVCGATSERVWTNETTDDLQEEFEQQVLGLRQESIVGFRSIKEICMDVLAEMEAAYANKGRLPGISSGFPDLDDLTGGFKEQEMIVVAGRPGTGKTTFAMNVAGNVAVKQGIPVGIFSLEMSSNSLIARTICSMSSVESVDIREGTLVEDDFPKITNTVAKIANAPLYIIDSGGLTILQIHAQAKRLTHQFGIKLWIIDYLQLIRATHKRVNRYEDVTDVSNGLKLMAKDLDLPVIALAQIGRDVEKSEREPRLSDLRDSGAIEQDADVVMFLHRQDSEATGPATPIKGLVAKQRNGPTGIVPFVFLRQFTRYESATRPQKPSMPDYDND